MPKRGIAVCRPRVMAAWRQNINGVWYCGGEGGVGVVRNLHNACHAFFALAYLPRPRPARKLIISTHVIAFQGDRIGSKITF